ncbi:hypothetical protein [Nonomuraea africana]|uniref:hypothetical protein n=1 Tax=Nonomuraea africana TaxID=46171 RepID=UPI00178AA952|nr:hypothetical protein [Nonomuraea africana]
MRLSDFEMAAVKIAAARDDMSPRAFAASAAVAVAEGRLVLVPLDRRELLAEFVGARVAINRIASALEAIAVPLDPGRDAELLQHIEDLRARLTPAVRRIEAAADTL